MYLLFVILIVIASLLMIGIVLIQESKGGGLSSNFASSNQMLGVRKTTDFVEKATWGLAITMVVLSVICAYVKPDNVGERSAVENVTTPALPSTPQGIPVSQGAEGAATEAAPAAEASTEAAPAADAAKAAEAPAAEAAPTAEAPAAGGAAPAATEK